jgi:hypothetical protein
VSKVFTILPARVDTRIFIGGCAAIVFAQLVNTTSIIWTMHRIAGHVVPREAAEAYAAGYAIGAVRGDQRQEDRRSNRRGRSADRARRRRAEDGTGA